MMANPRVYGPADNRAFFDVWLQADAALGKLFCYNIGIAPFDGNFEDPGIPCYTNLAWIGNVIRARRNPNARELETTSLVGCWADLLGPQIAPDLLCDQAEARRLFIDSVNAILPDNVRPRYNQASVAEIVARMNVRLRARNVPIYNLPQPAPAARRAALQDDDDDDPVAAGAPVFVVHTIEEAVAAIVALGQGAHVRYTIGGLSMLANVMCAVIKRGTMSARFCDKITRGIADDLNIPDVEIRDHACSMFYKTFGDRITDTTIAAIVARWTLQTPAVAVRFRIMLGQVANSGLTAFTIIGRAIRTYPDFDWQRVYDIMVPEREHYIAAVAAVGGNVWYGFRKELGAAKSTKFKNLAYVAKELLIKINAEVSLGQYAGWVRRCKDQAVIDTMIAEYETHRRALAMMQPGDPQPVYRRKVWEQESTDLLRSINAVPAVFE